MTTKFEDLPFVYQDGETTYPWVVHPVGNWATDIATGREYADALLDYMRLSGDLPAFKRVIQTSNAVGAIEVGFLNRIAEKATLSICLTHA